jgi:hypothetical protein
MTSGRGVSGDLWKWVAGLRDLTQDFGFPRPTTAKEPAGPSDSRQRSLERNVHLMAYRETYMVQIARYCLLAVVLLAASGQSHDSIGVAHKPDAQKSDDFLFEVQPRVIVAGEAALLRWSIKGATKVVIEEASQSSRELHKIGTFGGSGSLQVRPTEDTTYVVTCEGSTTYSCASVSIRVRVKQR